jgi:hypothetical protein
VSTYKHSDTQILSASLTQISRSGPLRAFFLEAPAAAFFLLPPAHITDNTSQHGEAQVGAAQHSMTQHDMAVAGLNPNKTSSQQDAPFQMACYEHVQTLTQQESVYGFGTLLLAAPLTAHTLSSCLDLGLQYVEGQASTRSLRNTAQHSTGCSKTHSTTQSFSNRVMRRPGQSCMHVLLLSYGCPGLGA